MKKRNLYLLSTEEHLRMTCNCPLWSLICGTENKGQTSLKMGDGKDKGTGREKGQRADFYMQQFQFIHEQ